MENDLKNYDHRGEMRRLYEDLGVAFNGLQSRNYVGEDALKGSLLFRLLWLKVNRSPYPKLLETYFTTTLSNSEIAKRYGVKSVTFRKYISRLKQCLLEIADFRRGWKSVDVENVLGALQEFDTAYVVTLNGNVYNVRDLYELEFLCVVQLGAANIEEAQAARKHFFEQIVLRGTRKNAEWFTGIKNIKNLFYNEMEMLLNKPLSEL